MNKRLWVSIVLSEADESVVKQLLDHSYALTDRKPRVRG